MQKSEKEQQDWSEKWEQKRNLFNSPILPIHCFSTVVHQPEPLQEDEFSENVQQIQPASTNRNLPQVNLFGQPDSSVPQEIISNQDRERNQNQLNQENQFCSNEQILEQHSSVPSEIISNGNRERNQNHLSRENQFPQNEYIPEQQSQQSSSFHPQTRIRRRSRRSRRNLIPPCSKNIKKQFKRLIIKYVQSHYHDYLSLSAVQNFSEAEPSLPSFNNLYSERGDIQFILKEMFQSRYLVRQIQQAEIRDEKIKRAYIKKVQVFKKGFQRGHLPRIQ